MSGSDQDFKQSLSLTDATMLVAGSMIGSGIFIVSADVTRNLGSSGWMLLAWVLAGVLTLIAALSYGELAGMFPKAGGQYVYLREAFNPLIAFMYGWTMFTVIQAGTIAAVAVAFAKFTSYFIPWFGEDNILFSLGSWNFKGSQVLAILSILVLSGINLRGVNLGKVVQTSFTLAKLVAIFGLIILGLTLGFNQEIFTNNFTLSWDAQHWDGSTFSSISGVALILALGGAMVGTLFSSDAWNNVTFIAGEIKDPSRNIPKSLFFGTLIVTVIYLLTNVTYLGLLPLQGSPNGTDVVSQGIAFATNDRVGTAAASLIFGVSAAAIMSVLIMVSTFGCNNGLILSGSRLYYAMAKDNLFFPKAGRLNENAVPGFGIKAQAIWASALCLTGTYGALLDYTIFAALLFYILTIAGIFVLRRKSPDTFRPYKAFGYPVLPILYIVCAAVIAFILLIDKTENTLPGLFIVLLGIPVYYVVKKKFAPVKV
ncbi:MAG: amino acid permease [Saprospiraceae bacterium]|jgi:APA family basic amino acid/polyamine antiporter|nr:amino acid permease [Candidatus Brachybacter algidus]